MSFSFRRKPDLARAEAFAAREARNGAPYVRPTDLYEFRAKYRLSRAAAAALLDRSESWWTSRETGFALMQPDMFARAQAAIEHAPRNPPPRTTAARMAELEARNAALAARLAQLEERVQQLEQREVTHSVTCGPAASKCDLL
jgi:DNA-binding transcriptional MerR regulator